MTIRQLKLRDLIRAPLLAEMHRTVGGNEPRPDLPGKVRPKRNLAAQLPSRPDDSVLSATIPLFYIGRNSYGFWVAREAEGRGGGLFFFKCEAMRFARTWSAPVGCAMMFLNEPFELDLENQGDRLVEPVQSAIEAVAYRAPRLASFARMAFTEWRKLVAQVSRVFAGARRNREAIENDLFHDQYMLSSKNDDDLPIVG
jgi:hypothetical protein